MKKPHKSRQLPIRHQGFALVVTLSLMILLTIIAVGLLSLSSIALRSTSGSSAMAEARQNARLALMLAVGELQKYAGQDQRVTATADIAGDGAGLPLIAGAQPLNDKSVSGVSKGLSAVQPGTRYWTGIFANKDTPASIFIKTPTPAIVNWLVSGNVTDYPTSGPTILPSDATYAVGSSGQVADPAKAVVLAGENTVGAGAGSMDRYVVAPVLDIKDNISAKPVGRFAWWVGDEGVKARINIDKTLEDKIQYASLVAQRRGWETIPGLDSYPTPSSGNHGLLPRVTTLAQTELLIPGAGGAGAGSSPLQSVFHSATTDSRALLTDSLNGGTKVDLTALLAGALPTTNPVTTIANYPLRGSNLVSRAAAPRMKAPRWDAVKDFHDRYNLLESGSMIVKPATTEFTAAVAPIVTDLRILMGARIIPVSNMTNRDPKVSGTFRAYPCGKVAISIANPYSHPLKWNTDIEFEIKNQTPPGNRPSRIWPLGGGNGPAFIPTDTSEQAVFNNAIFRIRSATLEPGEARAYTIGSYVNRRAGSGTARVVVDLVPFASAAPWDFKNCVELEHSTVFTTQSVNLNGVATHSVVMDVRESWQTTLATLEMRLAGSSGGQILRRIERFELDNGYFSPNQRRIAKTDVARLTSTIPLILFSFQISQPGMDYKNLMPPSYELGQRSSTLRTFTDFNLQATRVRKPIASYNPPPYFVQSNDSKSQLPEEGGLTGDGFTRDLAVSPMPWGHSPFGSQKTILFSTPRQLVSIAQLQHADLTGDDLSASIAHQPGNAVGNSYASPFVKRRFTSQTRTSYELIGAPNHSGANPSSTTYYDLSYLLNASLWDSYYFSTIPSTGSSTPENPTIIRLDDNPSPDLKDPVNAASRLMVDGAFNFNSTDKNAWKAFLASAKHFEHAAGPAAVSDAAFPRSLDQASPSATPPSGKDADSFSGYRRLTDFQLDALAEEITKQVRLRGPFVSVSHFVNRALADLGTQPALTRCGALQSAIDESGANISFNGTKNAFARINAVADAVTLREKNGAPRADFDGGDTDGRPADADPRTPDWAKTSTDNNFGAVASILADREMLSDAKYKPEQGYRSTGIPGWLTQADVLQVIGPALTARSDTFRIRAFGESLDAAGKSVAKAYCEAIVQRTPPYIDPSNSSSDRGTTLSKLNTIHGRQFQIVSFRWLSPLEI